MTAPQHIEAEQALLGAILINNQAFDVLGALDAAHFFDPLHRKIFELIAGKLRAGQIVTPLTLKPHVDALNVTIGDLSISQYLARLVGAATTIINAPDYAAAILEAATRRALIAFAQGIDAAARTADIAATATSLIEDAEASLATLRTGAGADETVSHKLGDVADRLILRAEESSIGSPIPIPTSGLADIDFALAGGYRPGRLIVFAGRPGMGKTQFAIGSMRRTARKEWGVVFFSLEIDEDEMASRLIAAELAHGASAGGKTLDYRDILAGKLDADGIDVLRRGRDRVADLPFEIITEGGLTLRQIESRAKLVMAQFEKQGITPGVIVIDYLQKIRASDRYKGNRVQEVTEVIEGLKDLAKRLGVCFVVLSQLSRDVEKRDDKRPVLSDLRETGAIEQEADAVGFLYRPAYYDRKNPKVIAGDEEASSIAAARAHDLEVNFEKNRLGPPMTVTLYCDVANGLIDNKRGY